VARDSREGDLHCRDLAGQITVDSKINDFVSIGVPGIPDNDLVIV